MDGENIDQSAKCRHEEKLVSNKENVKSVMVCLFSERR